MFIKSNVECFSSSSAIYVFQLILFCTLLTYIINFFVLTRISLKRTRLSCSICILFIQKLLVDLKEKKITIIITKPVN